MLIIFSFSAKPAYESSEMSLSVGRTIANILIPDYGDWTESRQTEYAARIDYPVRKCAHALEYAVLGILLLSTALVYGVKRKRAESVSVAVGIAYAASDEFHQLFVPGRSGRITDVMIDSAGLIAGMLCVCFLINICNHFKKHNREHNIEAETARKP